MCEMCNLIVRYRVIIIITSACLYVGRPAWKWQWWKWSHWKFTQWKLSHLELSLLDKAGIAIPTSEVLFSVSQFVFTKINNTVVMAQSQSQMTKRDNSCLLYTNMALHCSWAILEKIFAFKNCASPVCCLVSMLSPLSSQLCTDDMT